MSEKKFTSEDARKWVPIVFSAISGLCTIGVFVFYDATLKDLETTQKELANINLKIDNELRTR